MEMEETQAQAVNIEKIKAAALAVITRPAEFYRSMPTSGGFQEPLIFMVILSVFAGIVHAVFTLPTSVGAAIGILVATPILVGIMGFVAAAIMMVIWKLMGSGQSYEVAYRCIAYAAAVSPIIALLSYIPYLGGVVATGWGLYLAYLASVEVHRIAAQKARLVWGIFFVILAMVGISSEAATRRMRQQLDRYQQQIERGDMTPEEAGKIFGDFLKGMQKSTQEE